MAFKHTLLATVALPLLALTGLVPANAAALARPDLSVTQRSDVLRVQSEEELLKQQRREERKERREKRKEQNAAEDNGDAEQPKRKRQKQAEEQQNNDGADNAGQTEEPVKPRRKKQAEAEQNDDTGADNAGQDDKPAKRPKNQAQQDQNADDGNGAVEEIETRPAKRDKADKGGEGKPENQRRRKDIAADPSKTTDTVELPVENGAAVLDSDKDADKRGNRETRKREREEARDVRVPKNDRDAQRDQKRPERLDPVLRDKGERLTGFKGYDDAGGRRVNRRDNDTRVIINLDGRIVIRGDDDRRLSRRGDTRYERLNDGRIREIVIRPNGDRIVTVRNRWGEIIRRSRLDNRDREVVIFFSPDLNRGRDRLFLRDPGADLPPMRLRIPVRDYIIDVSSDKGRNYRAFLDQPPVEPVERVYSVDEVKYSARIRDKMRRIDLDTITFETGSAEISMGQASSLKQVGQALAALIEQDPGETFLIEGHTDAVGSDESNLVLSDSRAESVASVLSEVYDIPPENLVTQGYGERFLKIETDEAERANRRVTIRRISPLVRPLASAEE